MPNIPYFLNKSENLMLFFFGAIGLNKTFEGASGDYKAQFSLFDSEKAGTTKNIA